MENKHGRFAFMPLSYKSRNRAIDKEMIIDYDEGSLYVRRGNEDVLIASSKVSAHIYDMDNPHNVTKEQVGLGNVENVIPVPVDDFDRHKNNTNNPHRVTKEQVGLGNVENYDIARIEDIVDGRKDKYLTPSILIEYLDEYGIIIDGGDDPGVDPGPPPVKEGVISFIIDPMDAIVSVFIDGIWKRGTTHKVIYGSYQYKIEKQGYESKTGSVTVNMPMVTVKETIFEMAPDMGKIMFAVYPNGSKIEVEIDGIWTDVFNNIQVEYGRYRYRITMDEYFPVNDIVIVDKEIVEVSHVLTEIPSEPEEPGEDPDEEDEENLDPGQVDEDEIYIMDFYKFSHVVIERANGTEVNMTYNSDEGILSGHKPGEMYRVTLTPRDIKYKIVFLYVNADTTGKFIEVELEEEEMANFTFKATKETIDLATSYKVHIKSDISSIDENNVRYIDKTIVSSIVDIEEVSLPKSLYNIEISVVLLDGYEYIMRSARTEYLQDIDFLITVNDHIKVKLVELNNSNAKVGMFTDIPIARFTTMTIPKRPNAIINTIGDTKYVYVPNDSDLHVMISEPGKMPRMKTISDINKNTVIDLNDI